MPFKTAGMQDQKECATTSPKLILFLLLENVSVTLKLLENVLSIFKDSKLQIK